MKRSFLLATLIAATITLHAAEPKRGGGLFGFGAPEGEQISAGLFPSANSPTPASEGGTSSATTKAANQANQDSEAIFRSGQPQKVDAVSYVIENGRKIEKPVDASNPVSAVPIQAIETPEVEGKKKGGLFAFGKRGDATVEENKVVTPVPMPETFAVAGPKPVVASPVAAASTQAKPVASPIPPVTAVAAADTPAFEGIKKEKEEKSGWGPFRSKKKVEPPVAVTTAVTATPVVAEPVAASPSVPAGSTTKPSTEVAATTNTFEVPRNEAKKDNDKKDEKSNHTGGILSPIANLRPPRKEIDFSSAETIIQNGEIVAGSNTTFDAAPMTNSAGPRQAPQVINGVKTYSSWSDVNARSSSAADRIIEKIR